MAWSIAAAGNSVFVTYVDVTQRELLKLAISHDRGATWRTLTVAAGGWYEGPTVAAAGALLVVAWRGQDGIMARVSMDAGGSWAKAAAIGGGNSAPEAAAVADRAVVGWDPGDCPTDCTSVRVWQAGAWGPVRLVGYDKALGGLALSGETGIALTEFHADMEEYGGNRDPEWVESPDQGVTWLRSALADASSATWIYWPQPNLRYVLVGDELRTGRGSP
jgi:hypothetical protein